MNDEKIITVDSNDVALGSMGKLLVHQEGILHRAFSIFIMNDDGKIMLQKRAITKYHSGGLWTNTCCGHPREDEEIDTATHRRLKEEMGFDCNLREIFVFKYQVALDNNLQENEIDHVFIGDYQENPVLNKDEADDWKWMSVEEIETDIKSNSDAYTFWLKIALPKLKEFLHRKSS